jgi:hypothetical protein
MESQPLLKYSSPCFPVFLFAWFRIDNVKCTRSRGYPNSLPDDGAPALVWLVDATTSPVCATPSQRLCEGDDILLVSIPAIPIHFDRSGIALCLDEAATSSCNVVLDVRCCGSVSETDIITRHNNTTTTSIVFVSTTKLLTLWQIPRTPGQSRRPRC